MQKIAKATLWCLAAVALAGAAPRAAAETRAPELCGALPKVEAERALGIRTFGLDTLDDRLGPYRRQICRLQTEPGETLELTLWRRQDGQPFAPLPARAEACEVGCLAAGREPNLYLYEQKRIGSALCVLRRPRPDRDLATGPITACTAGGARRLMLVVSRKQGLAAAPMETVKALLDRAVASLR
ncbi:MAG: hypothetical protein ACREIP_01360 [Alphaproteobacteria bacterium]